MSETIDTAKWQVHDIWAAFSLLSRLKVPVDHTRSGERGAAATWAFPLVGLILGGAAGIVAVFAGWLGLPAGLVAVVALASLALTTGGMHEDGLADFADSLGGHSTEQRLNIMKDSRIGAYGVIALVIAILARWSSITELSGWALILTLAAVGASSRAVMVVMMYVMPPAREDGLSAAVGKPSIETVWTAVAIALTACVLLTGLSGIVLFGISIVGAMPVYRLAMRSIGGQTGDVLGAGQQFAEIAGLAAALILL